MIEDADDKYENSKVSSCEQVKSNSPSSTIDDTEGGSESSGGSSREQLKASPTVYNTEGCTSSENFNNL